ncbi:Ceramide kinase [Pteropus alecto]|uniref:Ceramide kinase n=1 Tax=Pteropus alecto TaxID=9402 RepID=L5K9V1_PTEAL|nr:Ceramide kinase [Pteropus alecto]
MASRAVVTDACSVPVSEIITVEETDSHGKQYGSGKWQKMEKPFAFTVHRVRRARRHRWRCAQVTFCCADEQLCHLWLQTLREQLDKLISEPASTDLNSNVGVVMGTRGESGDPGVGGWLGPGRTGTGGREAGAVHVRHLHIALPVPASAHPPLTLLLARLLHSPLCRPTFLLLLEPSRPKHLLVFINPFGGKGRGERIYARKVAPLFTLASITTEIIVTERANHAKESLYEMNIDTYDGVVCVGGDGMFSEVLHGLVGRTQRSAGVDQNQPRAALVPSSLRIGVIPAGSTDCVCYSTVGTDDAETSALHIIVGDSLAMDVSSVHHGGTLLRYWVSLLGYGFYGDIIRDSEKKRWMGLIRYDFSGLKTFLSHHCYEGTVSFLPAQHTVGSPRDRKPCRAGCFVCRQSRQQLEEEQKKSLYGLENSEEMEEWKVVCGKFLAINAMNMTCACSRSPGGLSPAAHLGDGSLDLILIRKCSRFNFLRFLIRHTNQHDQFDFTFVEVYRIKKFQFMPKHLEDDDGELGKRGKRFGEICSQHPSCCCPVSRSSWNCDGEILHSSAIEVRVHCQLVRLFARGIEGAEQPRS